MSRARSATAVGVVLAGGAGSRLGGAKATAPLSGRPLLTHPVDAFRAAGMSAVVLAKPGHALGPLDCEVLIEPAEPLHPLLGVTTALRELAPAPIVVCACDMPLVPAALLAHLAGLSEPLVVAAPGGRVQPLLARYEPTLAPALEDALGELAPLTATVAALGARLLGDRELSLFGDPQRICVNVNTPAELALAERALARAAGAPDLS